LTYAGNLENIPDIEAKQNYTFLYEEGNYMEDWMDNVTSGAYQN